MDRQHEFRIYYNHTIHPELVRLEKQRKRLLWLLLISVIVLTGIVLLELYVNVFLITLLMMIPLSLYVFFLMYRFRQFVVKFKPRVINLILDFIALDKFTYHPDKKIEKPDFLASKIFATAAPYYKGEDYIYCDTGTVEFEMCELNVREFSKVRSRLNYVFKGIFLKADFGQKVKGSIYILPKEFEQFLTRTIKQFTRAGAGRISASSTAFGEAFMMYATPKAPVSTLFSLEVQRMIVDYRKKSGKEIYISFINGTMCIAITEPKDILEPYLFQSNVSFELVREFYEDLYLLFTIVDDFDKYH